MIRKGTIVVRTNIVKDYVNDIFAPGYIFETLKDNTKDLAYYDTHSFIHPRNYRLATPRELMYFQKHYITNISEIPKSKAYIPDFCVYIGRNQAKFDRYIGLCKSFIIPYKEHWKGTGTYYGIKDNKSKASADAWTRNSFGISEIAEHLEELDKATEPNFELPSNYTVAILRSSAIMKEYIELCIAHNIPYTKSWAGNAKFYGLVAGQASVANNEWSDNNYTLTKFKNLLNGEKDNKSPNISGANLEESGSNQPGTAHILERGQQIAVGKRPQRNKTRYRIRDTRIVSVKVESHAILY